MATARSIERSHHDRLASRFTHQTNHHRVSNQSRCQRLLARIRPFCIVASRCKSNHSSLILRVECFSSDHRHHLRSAMAEERQRDLLEHLRSNEIESDGVGEKQSFRCDISTFILLWSVDGSIHVADEQCFSHRRWSTLSVDCLFPWSCLERSSAVARRATWQSFVVFLVCSKKRLDIDRCQLFNRGADKSINRGWLDHGVLGSDIHDGRMVIDKRNDSFGQGEDRSVSTEESLLIQFRFDLEVNLFWIGRISNRIWFDDYSNFSSLRSNDLRLQLQNLVRSHSELFVWLSSRFSLSLCFILIHRWSALDSISTLFSEWSTIDWCSCRCPSVSRPGSILFAVKVGLLSDRSVNETVDVIDERLRSLNSTLAFDRTRHYIQPVLDESQFVILFERVPSSTNVDDLRNSTDSKRRPLIKLTFLPRLCSSRSRFAFTSGLDR